MWTFFTVGHIKIREGFPHLGKNISNVLPQSFATSIKLHSNALWRHGWCYDVGRANAQWARHFMNEHLLKAVLSVQSLELYKKYFYFFSCDCLAVKSKTPQKLLGFLKDVNSKFLFYELGNVFTNVHYQIGLITINTKTFKIVWTTNAAPTILYAKTWN